MVANDNERFNYDFWIKWTKRLGWALFIGAIVVVVVIKYT